MPTLLPVPLPELVRLLSEHYGIDAKEILPLALDQASAALTALVKTHSGEAFFLKFKR